MGVSDWQWVQLGVSDYSWESVTIYGSQWESVTSSWYSSVPPAAAASWNRSDAAELRGVAGPGQGGAASASQRRTIGCSRCGAAPAGWPAGPGQVRAGPTAPVRSPATLQQYNGTRRNSRKHRA